jgi:hypothetical protein
MSQSNFCVSVTCEVDSPLLNFEKQVVYLNSGTVATYVASTRGYMKKNWHEEDNLSGVEPTDTNSDIVSQGGRQTFP